MTTRIRFEHQHGQRARYTSLSIRSPSNGAATILIMVSNQRRAEAS